MKLTIFIQHQIKIGLFPPFGWRTWDNEPTKKTNTQKLSLSKLSLQSYMLILMKLAYQRVPRRGQALLCDWKRPWRRAGALFSFPYSKTTIWRSFDRWLNQQNFEFSSAIYVSSRTRAKLCRYIICLLCKDTVSYQLHWIWASPYNATSVGLHAKDAHNNV